MHLKASEMLTSSPQLHALPIRQALEILIETCRCGGKILTCGNGGSASDSEHIVGELMKGFLLRRRLTEAQREAFRPFGEDGKRIADRLQNGVQAIALNSQTSLLTAVGNDVSFEMVFAQQVYVYGKKNDTLIAMTTSGNSKNIIYAAIAAKAIGMSVIGITGRNPGELARCSDVCLAMPAEKTYRVQEMTQPVYHALCAMVEEALFPED